MKTYNKIYFIKNIKKNKFKIFKILVKTNRKVKTILFKIELSYLVTLLIIASNLQLLINFNKKSLFAYFHLNIYCLLIKKYGKIKLFN
jgi:hypothetical protein